GPVKQAELRAALLAALDPEARAAQGEAAEVAPPPRAASPAGLRVLLAEDNPINRKVAQGMLQKQGHTVRVARDGQEVLDLLSGAVFDVVLMDVQMPGMDGLEATAQVRQREAAGRGHVPIIALTAHAMSGDRERCLAAGMDDFVSKPI